VPRLALTGVQLAVPTERPLAEAVCDQHGAWDLDLVTRNPCSRGHVFLQKTTGPFPHLAFHGMYSDLFIVN